ncbi:MAG: endolytic transglycosylase MltG [Gaiellales bacterium]
MEERPYVRHRAGAGTRILAILGGLVLGFGALGAIAWALVGSGGGGDASPPSPTTTTGPPPKPVLRIIFPEGFTRAEMTDRIVEVNKIAKNKRKITTSLSPRNYMRLTGKPTVPEDFPKTKVPHMEGFLFPATYEFTEDTTAERLIELQLEAFMRAWAKVDSDYAESKNLTAYEVVIIASMVEEEVLVPKERPLVAAVIYNRLRVGLPLGIDATIRYGLKIPPTEPIHVSELESDSPYNTRKFLGLPPTPISNPGLASLQAAAHPAEVDYLYFIRKKDCKSHFFTASEEEFLSYSRAGLQC